MKLKIVFALIFSARISKTIGGSMERDSVLLAVSLEMLKSVLSRILKNSNSNNNPNLLSFLLRFLFTVRSLNPILEEIVKKLSCIQCKDHKQLGDLDLFGAWINEKEIKEKTCEADKLYFGVVYPTARALDAQGASRLFNRASIDMGLRFLGVLIENNQLDNISNAFMFLPIFWGIFNASSYASSTVSAKTREWLNKVFSMALNMKKTSDLVLLDMLLGIKYMTNPAILSQNEIQIIREAMQKQSLAYKLKAWKWLCFFGFQVPDEFIHNTLSLLDNYIYGILHQHLGQDFFYYTSIAEDLLFILTRDRKQKALANYLVTTLSSDRSWLSADSSPDALIPLVIGASLLFAAWYVA